jgi:glutathione S-transferase
MSYKLYYMPGSAAMAPHALLIETGVATEFIRIDHEKNEQKASEYLKLNPHGRVPTLVYDGGKVMYESAAICQFLTERHPEMALAPLPGGEGRALFLQWMAYLTNTLQETLMQYWYPHYFVDGEGEQAKVTAKAEERLGRMFSLLDGELAKTGPHLCGARFYACDYYLAMLIRWSRNFPRPGHSYAHLNALVRAALARPAYARMLQDHGIEQPV